MTKSFKIVLSIVGIIGSLFFSSCNEEVLTDLQSQIDALKSGQIASLDAQVKNIQNSIAALETTDTELKEYIKTLQAQQSMLAQEDQKLAEAIAAVKEDLKDSVSTVRANLMAQLEAHRQTVADQVAMINASLETLTAKDQALENQIASLKEYTDGEIQKTKDWASATFVTLEKYNETVTLVCTIQEQIAAINTRMEEFQQSLNSLSSRIDGLEFDLTKAIADNAAALAEASSNITAAYTEAIATAIAASETSLKNWVAGELTAYYTAAQTDAKLDALQATLQAELNSQKVYFEELLKNLETDIVNRIASIDSLIAGFRNRADNLSSTSAGSVRKIADNTSTISATALEVKSNARLIATNPSDTAACRQLINANNALLDQITDALSANQTELNTFKDNALADEQPAVANATTIIKKTEEIATTASLMASDAAALTNNAAAILNNAADILKLQQDLTTACTELTTAYQEAIATAINTLDGKLTGEIATQINTANGRIDAEVATINSAIEALAGRVTACEADIAAIQKTISEIQAAIEALQQKVTDLLARIQSISYVPKYSDAKAVMTFADTGSVAPGFAVLDFKIQPKSAAAVLAAVWQEALKVEAVSAETRTAPEVTNLPIQSVTAENGYLSVIVSGTGLQNAFFSGEKSAFITLVVSDGNNERASEYVPLFPELAITLNDAADLTPVSVTLSGKLGKETARRAADKIAIYYSVTESTQSGLLENGTKVELTPSNTGSFSSFLSPLTSDATYHYVAAVKDCGQWFYSPVKLFVTLNYTAEAVDMGLPSGLKWASYNLGASSPEQSGAYFAWGETEPKPYYEYVWGCYKWCNGTYCTITKYCPSGYYGTVDNLESLEKSDDAASLKLNNNWRIPTSEEWDELRSYCNANQHVRNEVNGILYTSKVNGNSLFIPNTGCMNGYSLPNPTTYYWSSTVNPDYPYTVLNGGERCLGCPIRPVKDWDWSQINVTVTTLAVDALGCHSAHFNGSLIVISDLNPKKTVWFLYGENLSDLKSLIASGTKINTAPLLDGSFWANSGNLALREGTKYYYVACAQVGTRTIYGEVESFTTKDYSYTAEAVDMGLSVKWSSVNLGASEPEDDGAYFAWGETATKASYNWLTYSLCGGSEITMYKYCTSSDYGTVDNKKVLEESEDVAAVKLGGNWHIPTDAEWEELRDTDNCTWTWTTKNGVNGYKVSSKKTGNSIFLPAVGYRDEGNLLDVGPYGYYWSSSLITLFSSRALSIYFSSFYVYSGNYDRYYGQSVRPVCD